MLRSYSKSVAKRDEADSAFDDDLDLLHAYSLATGTAGIEAWEMHALVQFCTQVWRSTSPNPKQWDQVFLALMASEFPQADSKNWSKCQHLLPHCDVLYRIELFEGDSVITWAWLLDDIAQYMQEALG
jgi:hypothetical protein